MRIVCAAQSPKLRIIVFGAHPDDCEFSAGGTAAQWAAQGHHVKFVSCTNGDIGHWRMAGGPLARRRAAEVQRCAEILGNHVEVLDIHDGELMVTMENRRLICRLIRDWQADLVLSHRPNDYHPDHRYVGVLVMDAAFMVTVPHFCPDTPHLTKNPVFLFTDDEFLGYPYYSPSETALRFRGVLARYYGKDRAENIRYAEAFEVCEYGRKPEEGELKRLFPFFGA